jgi:hypothetical protein
MSSSGAFGGVSTVKDLSKNELQSRSMISAANSMASGELLRIGSVNTKALPRFEILGKESSSGDNPSFRPSLHTLHKIQRTEALFCTCFPIVAAAHELRVYLVAPPAAESNLMKSSRRFLSEFYSGLQISLNSAISHTAREKAKYTWKCARCMSSEKRSGQSVVHHGHDALPVPCSM